MLELAFSNNGWGNFLPKVSIWAMLNEVKNFTRQMLWVEGLGLWDVTSPSFL